MCLLRIKMWQQWTNEIINFCLVNLSYFYDWHFYLVFFLISPIFNNKIFKRKSINRSKDQNLFSDVSWKNWFWIWQSNVQRRKEEATKDISVRWWNEGVCLGFWAQFQKLIKLIWLLRTKFHYLRPSKNERREK